MAEAGNAKGKGGVMGGNERYVLRISVNLGLDMPDDAIEWRGESADLNGTIQHIDLLLSDGFAAGRMVAEIAHRLMFQAVTQNET